MAPGSPVSWVQFWDCQGFAVWLWVSRLTSLGLALPHPEQESGEKVCPPRLAVRL